MPKKSDAWSVRVDDVSGVSGKVVKWCEEKGVVLCVREEADNDTPNPHYHMAIRTPGEVTQETIRNWVKSLLPTGFTKHDFSTAVWDGEEALLRYLCKGPNWAQIKKGEKVPVLPPKVIFRQLLGKTVEDLHSDFWKENAIKGPAVKKRREDIVKECVAAVKDSGLESYAERMELASGLILDAYSGKVNDHVAFPILQSVMWTLDRRQATADFHARMLKKFSRY